MRRVPGGTAIVLEVKIVAVWIYLATEPGTTPVPKPEKIPLFIYVP
jgi:hypothetical protein